MQPHWTRRRSAGSLVVALLIVLVLLVPAPSVGAGPAPVPPGVHAGPSDGPWNFTLATVNYTSSVDGFPLSYTEVLPTSFDPATTYPLGIELHGIATDESTPLAGGYPTIVENSTAEAAVDHGFLLIIPNTRTGDGYFTDSIYDGPQAQDVLDAIHHEQGLRHIGKLYLYGFSMGTIGTLSIGLNHPGMFAGLGVIAPFADVFELQDRLISIGSTTLESAGLLPTGGLLPNQSAYARGIFYEMSPLRFYPENLSNTLLYVTAGGFDPYSTDNPDTFPFEQANDTLLNSTCLVASALDEPDNCTTPVAGLAATDPSAYSFRYLFEPDGGHSYYLMNATDLFAYFSGEVPGGEYWGDFPSPSPGPDPVPLVTLVTQPSGCGSVGVDQDLYPSVTTVPLDAGAHEIDFEPCAGTALRSVGTTGQVQYNASAAALTVQGNGVVLATFASTGVLPHYTVAFGSSDSCLGIAFNGTSESVGGSASVFAGTYLVLAQGCPGDAFVGWAVTGGVSVANRTASETEVVVVRNGSLTVLYTPVAPPPQIVEVLFGISPVECGAISFGPGSEPDGTSGDFAVGSYNISAPSCSGWAFAGWSSTSGLAVAGNLSPTTTASLTAAASLDASYATTSVAYDAVGIAVDPATCGGVVGIDGILYSNSTTANLTVGAHRLSAAACTDEAFQAWATGGPVQVTGSILEVQGNGSLSATFTPSPGGPPKDGQGSSASSPSTVPEIEAGVVGAVVGALAVAVVWKVLPRKRPPSRPKVAATEP